MCFGEWVTDKSGTGSVLNMNGQGSLIMQQKWKCQWKCQQTQRMEQESAVVLNNVSGKLLLPSEGMSTFPTCNHAEPCIPYSFPSWWKDEPSQPCSLGTLPWSDSVLSTHTSLALELGVHWGTVIKKNGKGASNHLAGRPVGLILLGIFLPPVFAKSGGHPLRRLMGCMLG